MSKTHPVRRRWLHRWLHRSAAVGLAAAAVTTLLASSSVGQPVRPAAPSASVASAWTRYPATDFTVAPGDLCSFGFSGTATFDRVYVRTTATFADGSPRRQEYSGPLVSKLTNASTGKSISRDLSGFARASHRRDGSYDLAIYGPAAVGFRKGDSEPRGYYRLDGFHVVRFAADGTRTLLVDKGTEENLCRPLGR